MPKIITAVLISLLLFMSSSHAVPSNLFRNPTCHDDVTTLPIFQLSTRYEGEWLKNGSIFLVDNDIWATAFHAVDHGPGIELTHFIILPNGSEIEATVLQTDPVTDIAILYAPSGNMIPMAKLSKPMSQFEPIWNIGLPGISDNTMISFEGVIMSVSGNIFLMSSAVAFPAMSGGPQVRCNENTLEVVGVVIKTAMDLFRKEQVEHENEVIENRYYYIIHGSKSSPHIAKNMVEVIFDMIDNEQNHN
jgi:hypothetical protein